MELAAQDDYGVIPRKSLITNDLIAIGSKLDYGVSQLSQRMFAARRYKIDTNLANEISGDVQNCLDALNLVAEKVFRALGMEYDAPTGYELENSKPKKDQKQQQPAQKQVTKLKEQVVNPTAAPAPSLALVPAETKQVKTPKDQKAAKIEVQDAQPKAPLDIDLLLGKPLDTATSETSAAA